MYDKEVIRDLFKRPNGAEPYRTYIEERLARDFAGELANIIEAKKIQLTLYRDRVKNLEINLGRVPLGKWFEYGLNPEFFPSTTNTKAPNE